MKGYQLLIELNMMNPSVWRRVLVPADFTFSQLHAVIQISMGWLDFHLFRFSFLSSGPIITENLDDYEEYKNYSEKFKERLPERGEDPDGKIRKILEKKVKQPSIGIEPYLEEYKTFNYTYDFEAVWEHKISVEKSIDDCGSDAPFILAGAGACPPEDVGGIVGYRQFLQVWNDPAHFEHEAVKIWGKSRFYRDFDIALRNKLLKAYIQSNRKENAFIHPRMLLEESGDTLCSASAGERLAVNDLAANRMLSGGKICYNLTKLHSYLEDHPEEIPLIDIEVTKWRPLTFDLSDAEKLEEAELEEPALLVELSPDYYEMDESLDPESSILRCYAMIDGQNQLLKAYKTGKKTIKACPLKVEQHSPFITRGYLEFARFWNKELEYLP